eukprot:scaffold42316_cov18-Prasinocladus_malaysianus.AAC.1
MDFLLEESAQCLFAHCGFRIIITICDGHADNVAWHNAAAIPAQEYVAHYMAANPHDVFGRALGSGKLSFLAFSFLGPHQCMLLNRDPNHCMTKNLRNAAFKSDWRVKGFNVEPSNDEAEEWEEDGLRAPTIIPPPCLQGLKSASDSRVRPHHDCGSPRTPEGAALQAGNCDPELEHDTPNIRDNYEVVTTEP